MEQTVRCARCGAASTYEVADGRALEVDHECPGGWERVR